MHEPGTPRPYRSDLPPLDREKPVGYRSGWQLEERVLGLLVALLGAGGLVIVYFISTGVLPAGLPPPAPPPGVLVQVPLFNATSCLLPLMTGGSIALLGVGLRRVFDP